MGKNVFELNGSQPKKLMIRDTANTESVTRTYSVIAEYEWAESVLCSGCFLDDAKDIAQCVGFVLGLGYDVPRCGKCNWPLHTKTEDGCTAGNCSHRTK